MTQNQVAVSDIRTVPVGVDLTVEEQRLEVLRGLDTMKRVDMPLASGVALGLGEWGALNASGQVVRPTSTAVPMTYLCFAGTDRFDVKATGKVTLIMNSLVVAKSLYFDTTLSYPVGTALTAKLIAGGTYVGFAGLVPAAGSDPVHARSLGVAGGMLTFETHVP